MTDKTEAQRLADVAGAHYLGLGRNDAAAIAAELLRLESEVQEQCRINGMGAERELALMAKVDRLEAENAALRDLLGRIVGNHDASLRTLVKMNGGQPVNISLHGEQADNVKEILGLMAEARAALSGTAPARVPLTDEQIDAIGAGIFSIAFLDVEEVLANREIARAIEAAHGITGDAA